MQGSNQSCSLLLSKDPSSYKNESASFFRKQFLKLKQICRFHDNVIRKMCGKDQVKISFSFLYAHQ